MHGYGVRPFETAGDDPQRLVEVDLAQDGLVVLTHAAFEEVTSHATDGASFRALVLAAKAQAGEEWRRERGPASDLAAGIEAGTPTSDHSSDPPA